MCTGFHTPQGVGPLSTLSLVLIARSTWSFHTPQGVGPLSTTIPESKTSTRSLSFHTPQGVGPLSTLVYPHKSQDLIKFPYPSGRWTSVDVRQLGTVYVYTRFHTPQGVGPLSTVGAHIRTIHRSQFPYPSGRWTSVDAYIGKTNVNNEKFPYPSGRWTSVDNHALSAFLPTRTTFPYPSGRWTSVDDLHDKYMMAAFMRFHTPQGVGPLSTP